MSILEKLRVSAERNSSMLCVGLDPDHSRIPSHLGSGPHSVVAFNKAVIRATQDIACAYKPNLGFYMAYGQYGIQALVETRRAIPEDIPVILDCKVGDIPVTAEAYARGYFDELDFDAITAHPFLGKDSLEPLLSRAGRGVFILAKTSNPGSGDMQDRVLEGTEPHRTVFEQVAHDVAEWQKEFGTCGLVVGATYPAELERVRSICPDVPLLVPGVGAQEGDLEATMRAALSAGDGPVLINASRSVIYAGGGPDFVDAVRQAAIDLRERINTAAPKSVSTANAQSAT
jgi:orotidine-5'-phosphate decarboxylase